MVDLLIKKFSSVYLNSFIREGLFRDITILFESFSKSLPPEISAGKLSEIFFISSIPDYSKLSKDASNRLFAETLANFLFDHSAVDNISEISSSNNIQNSNLLDELLKELVILTPLSVSKLILPWPSINEVLIRDTVSKIYEQLCKYGMIIFKFNIYFCRFYNF